MNKLLIGSAVILVVAGAAMVAKHNDAIAKHNEAIEQCRRDTIARLTAEANAKAAEAARREEEEFVRAFSGMSARAFSMLFTPDVMAAQRNRAEEARRKTEQQIVDASRDICDHLINGR
jgi:flagellar biosynthesis/type III secretory pathway protein FliH